MSVTIQCAIKSIRDKLNEIEEMLKIIYSYDMENNAKIKKDKGDEDGSN